MASVETEQTTTIDGRSIHSSSSDMFQLDFDNDPNKTHHLLKHCLSNGQRNEALQHFSHLDVKEAAKEISKMGQRELQTKFKLVYGTATHSNNNDWLRRKLYEAIGAAPIKAATKTKVRKPPAKTKKPSLPDPLYQAPSTNQLVLGAMERRSRRAVKGTPKGLALTQSLKFRRPGSLPSSPTAGRSVLDIHKFVSHDIATSTSEDETGSYYEEDNNNNTTTNHTTSNDDDDATPTTTLTCRPDMVTPGNEGRPHFMSSHVGGRMLGFNSGGASEDDLFRHGSMLSAGNLAQYHGSQHQGAMASTHQSRNGSFERDPLLGSSSLPMLPPHLRRLSYQQQQQQQRSGGPVSVAAALSGLPRRPSSASFAGIVGAAQTDFFQSDAWCSDAWCSDAWAEVVLKSAAARLAPPVQVSQLTGMVEDEDVMLVPVDLSAFDAAGTLL